MATKTKGATTSQKGAQYEDYAVKHVTSNKATNATSGSKTNAHKGKGQEWTEESEE